MPQEKAENCSCKPCDTRGLDRLLHKLTDAWFNDNFKDWGQSRRFACALAGSATFFFGFVPVALGGVVEEQLLLTLALDVDLLFASSIALTFLAVFALWIAFLVSWRNTQSGPTRLFLSGVLLPAFVVYALSKIVN